MTRKLILFTATPLLVALGACTSDQKEPDQKQATSPSLSEGEPGIDDIIDVDEHPSIVNWVNS